MARNKSRGAPLATVAPRGVNGFPTRDNPAYPTSATLLQDPIDVIALLAARSHVHPATVRAHLAAFGIGEARS